MAKIHRFAPDVRERAVRLLWDREQGYPSCWAAVKSIAMKVGCSSEALRSWVRRAERDTGTQPGPTTDDVQRLKELERENKELRRANEILKKAAVDSMGQRNSASKRVVGVSKSSRFRGRALSVAATRSRSCCVSDPIDTPFGKYRRNKRLVFSLVPRCHGLWGSAKYTLSPVFAVTC